MSASIRPIGFPCVVERSPLLAGLDLVHRVTLESADDFRPGDVVVMVGAPALTRRPFSPFEAATQNERWAEHVQHVAA